MAVRRPYVRPVQPGWWRRNSFFRAYMAREMTAPFVALYALILLAGLSSLAAGREAWDAYVAALRSPLSVGVHALIAAALAYHTYTWFQIMPKTMPPLFLGGRKVRPATLTGTGLIVAALCMIALWAFAGAAA